MGTIHFSESAFLSVQKKCILADYKCIFQYRIIIKFARPVFVCLFFLNRSIMHCKQPHYFFIILGEDSWGILTAILRERMIKGNCITAKFMPNHHMILLCYQNLQEHLGAASSCFANTENLNEQVLI